MVRYRASKKKNPTIHDLVPERNLQDTICSALTLWHWKYYHTLRSKGSNPGFPDIVAGHPITGKILFWELKVEGEKPDDDQQEWQDILTLAFDTSENVSVAVILPHMEDDALDLIQRWAKVIK